jgi:ABC-type uncharacterized transport system permease subunit
MRTKLQTRLVLGLIFAAILFGILYHGKDAINATYITLMEG